MTVLLNYRIRRLPFPLNLQLDRMPALGLVRQNFFGCSCDSGFVEQVKAVSRLEELVDSLYRPVNLDL